MDAKPIRLLAVTSSPAGKSATQELLGELKELFLRKSQDLEIVGVALNKRTAIQLIDSTHPDVVLIDLMLEGTRSIDIISHACGSQADVRALALCSGDPHYERVILALEAGALGFVCREADSSEVFGALRTILRGEHHLPLEETYEVLQQAAPELLVSRKETRARLLHVLLGLIPVAGLVGAFTEFLWREYWGKIGVRVVDMGVDASSRVTEFMISFLVFLGLLGPLLFINTWRQMIGAWVEQRPRLKTRISRARDTKVGRLPIGRLLFGDWMQWLAFAAVVLMITLPFRLSGGLLLTLLLGVTVAIALLAQLVGVNDQVPRILTLPHGRGPQTAAILGSVLLILMAVLGAEVFFLGPDLRTDGLHGYLAPRLLDLSARPVVLYDLDEKHEPLGALYLGGNADLYVLYDPCKKTVRFVPVGSSRVEFVDEVQCPP